MLNDPNSPMGTLKNRLLERLLIEFEGTLDTGSTQEMAMFESTFGELLAEENINLSRTERARLFETLVAEIAEYGRR